MGKFTITQTHFAVDELQIAERLQAFQDLTDNLEHDDLIISVEVLKENPDIVQFIKDVAPKEGQKLGLTDFVKIATKAYQKFA